MENRKQIVEDAKDESFLIRQLDVLNAQLNKPPIYIERNGRREIVHPLGGLKPKYIRERISELEADLHRLREHKRIKESSRKDAETQRNPKNSTNSMNSINSPDWRKPGQALWPERFDVETLERTRKRMGTYSFAALYQQKPVPTEGGLFKRAWFTRNIVQVPPPNLDWKRGYDLSFTANPDSDHSATLKAAYDKDGILYIDGCFRGRLSYPLQRKLLMHYIQTETRTEHGIELSANGHALLQDLRQMPQLYGKKFRGVKVETNKLTLALPWIALAEEGRVRLVAGPWNEEFIQEACSFPHGHHDDQIDAVSIAVSMHGEKKGKRFWTF